MQLLEPAYSQAPKCWTSSTPNNRSKELMMIPASYWRCWHSEYPISANVTNSKTSAIPQPARQNLIYITSNETKRCA